jgi:hypothetical protein
MIPKMIASGAVMKKVQKLRMPRIIDVIASALVFATGAVITIFASTQLQLRQSLAFS